MSFWGVVQTISGHESAVAKRVERCGHRTLVPKARFRIDGKQRIAPLFPGYLFAEIVSEWYDIRWCMGVLRLIMNGEAPAHMPDAEMVKIENEMGRNGLVKIAKAQPVGSLATGTQVRVLTGSFTGFSAIYQGMSPQEREIVLLDLLGRKVPVELNPEDRIAQIKQQTRTQQLAPDGRLRY